MRIYLITSSIFIGAPRAQATIYNQIKINEPGAIYKCNFDHNAKCNPFVFDQWGSHFDSSINKRDYDNEKKDYRWLGAAMDRFEILEIYLQGIFDIRLILTNKLRMLQQCKQQWYVCSMCPTSHIKCDRTLSRVLLYAWHMLFDNKYIN